MAEYTGFELGHCSLGAEFEDLQQLGEGYNDIHGVVAKSSDTQEPMGNLLIANDSQQLPLLEICTTKFPCKTGPIRVGFHTSSGHHTDLATCGGLFTFRGQLLSLTVAHILPRTDMAEGMANTSELSHASSSDPSSGSDDCEMTGVEDWDDDEEINSESLPTVASASSCSPSGHSDNEDSLLKNNNWPSPSEADISEAQPLQRAGSPPSSRGAESGTDTGSETCEQIGTVVTIERELDLALISIAIGTTERVQSLQELLLLAENYKNDILDAPVIVKTTHNAAIQGRRSETPIFMRLPGTKNFQLLYSIRLSIPIRAGDCGSWAFNEVSGKFVGFVVAGSPKTGLCLVSPARVALEKMITLLEEDAQLRTSLASRAPVRSLFVLPNPREA
ncbi:hypothetical protein E0Z10_g3805 [Xylaria hypoxylon]|uniref:Uncharacterized protein n=1 Tax=Xylaria hypoxylon TaxID=37992 RepID=A0A4Z0YML1_9PEZI|nr:hypothetical protein E0Z10_g3805 [Xylaria hypoxylon]